MSYINYVLEGIFDKRKVPPNPIKDKIGEELAKKYGLVYIGWWDMAKSGREGMLTFNDPERDNTTIVAKDEDDLKQRYKEKK
jgi:translation initiation factor 2 alpha subunit (eIF-2alpha)